MSREISAQGQRTVSLKEGEKRAKFGISMPNFYYNYAKMPTTIFHPSIPTIHFNQFRAPSPLFMSSISSSKFF